jgi:hypothetical protein
LSPDEQREVRFALDSLLEGTGFEPSVPRLPFRDGRHERRSHLQGLGPRRLCLPGVAPHSLSLRGGTASSNLVSSTANPSAMNGVTVIGKAAFSRRSAPDSRGAHYVKRLSETAAAGQRPGTNLG